MGAAPQQHSSSSSALPERARCFSALHPPTHITFANLKTSQKDWDVLLSGTRLPQPTPGLPAAGSSVRRLPSLSAVSTTATVSTRKWFLSRAVPNFCRPYQAPSPQPPYGGGYGAPPPPNYGNGYQQTPPPQPQYNYGPPPPQHYNQGPPPPQGTGMPTDCLSLFANKTFRRTWTTSTTAFPNADLWPWRSQRLHLPVL